MQQGHSLVANGNIAPCRFVKLDTSNEGRATACGAGEKPFGISQKATHNMSLSGGGTVDQDDGYAAVAGEMFFAYGQGHMGVFLELGGTVTVGDLLKASTNGVGIAVTANNDIYGARALASGTSGQLIPVEVVIGYYGA